MDDRRKTKAQLIEELQELRKQIAEQPSVASTNLPSLAPEQLERLAGSGTWIVDTDFVVRVANQAMCRLVDKQPEEILGCKCYDVMSGPACHSEACAMRRAFAQPTSVIALEERTPLGRVPLACRVVAHLIHDRGQEAVGIIEQIDEPDAPGAQHVARRGEVHVASSPEPAREHEGKPWLHEVGLPRSVLIVAPPTSRLRCAWADVVRRAGYALLTPGVACDPVDVKDAGPTVAILDLVLGELVTDRLHNQLREAYPNMPILVVSSSASDTLEARRWRRACTWYVPRAAGADELVRLIEDVSPPRPVLRSRPER